MLPFINNYLFLTFLSILALSNNLILFFIGWIGLNISLYGILLKGFNSYNIEVTLKYFISGAILTIFLLFGMLIFFLEFFSFNMDTASYLFLNNDSLYQNFKILGKVSELQKTFYFIIISVFLFKLGAFPFHFYLGDIYEALDLKKTMFLYTVPLKLVIFLTMLKFLLNFWYLGHLCFDLLVCSGLGSLFVSSISAIKQYKLKKFWGYSYLNSIGFVLVSTASGIGSEFGEVSFFTAKFYFFTYLLTWCGIFDILISFEAKYRKKVKELFYLADLLFLKKQIVYGKKSNKKIKDLGFQTLNAYQVSFFIFITSFMGLPPTLGFFAKTLVYIDLIETKNTAMLLVAILFLTPIMAYAYLKLVIYVVYPVNSFDLKVGKSTDTLENATLKSYKKKWVFMQNKENYRVLPLHFVNYANIIGTLPLFLIFVYVFDYLSIVEVTANTFLRETINNKAAVAFMSVYAKNFWIFSAVPYSNLLKTFMNSYYSYEPLDFEILNKYPNLKNARIAHKFTKLELRTYIQTFLKTNLGINLGWRRASVFC